MKKMLFICLLILFSLSCEKWETDPEKVELGTFRWKVNGKRSEKLSTLFGQVHPISAYYYADTKGYQPGFLSLQGISAGTGTVGIQKIGVFGIGEYQLSTQDCENYYNCDGGGYSVWGELREGKGVYYFLEKGKLTITKLDTVTNIISGNFYYNAVDDLGNKKRITRGVFNVNFYNGK